MDKTTSMKVFHKVYGYGKVIKTTDEKVYVDFSGKKRIFDYPNAFDKGYLLTDDTPALAMDDTPAALTMDDIKHHIMMLKINQRYKVGMTSEEFATRLLESKKLAVVPGTAFGDSGEGFIRISYAYSIEELKEALSRIRSFLKEIS